MADRIFGFGIVGCGMIAEYHVRAINELPNARVTALYSRNPDNAARIAALVETGKGTPEVFDDLPTMLARPTVEVVCICTPSGAHLQPALAAAQAGKHVVVEKPLEITTARCDAIINACESHGVQLATIFPSRFSQANRDLKRAIDQGRFGTLTLGDTAVKWWRTQAYYDSGGWRGTWALDGGGALMNQAIHNVDLLQWLMGDIESLSAQVATLAHDRIEVEDTAVAALRFRNGALGVIQAATSAWPGLLKRVEIHGSSGSARVEQDDVTLWNFAEPCPEDQAIQEAIARASGFAAGASDPKGISHLGHRDQLADFLAAIEQGRPPLIDGREGRKAVEIIRAIYASARSGRVIELPLSAADESILKPTDPPE
ncbi:oxidoreductase domain protein [Isosphaera pallida ATCC 43644]|uniref:Oxidoreductase domain protein n=1 Tax=Isosphaera pallida (strain ATCC 43644 / DSM 9630 / IS1B) TaxID=575540 RepID=E8R1V5_ISOPI|nr:Gfo/Idh/MocA family oxidoreductase [Isosphaera pallida]ADV61377.1 oxidoreductase domain protein [Isosphaera pallida ATCC 43644]